MIDDNPFAKLLEAELHKEVPDAETLILSFLIENLDNIEVWTTVTQMAKELGTKPWNARFAILMQLTISLLVAFIHNNVESRFKILDAMNYIVKELVSHKGSLVETDKCALCGVSIPIIAGVKGYVNLCTNCN